MGMRINTLLLMTTPTPSRLWTPRRCAVMLLFSLVIFLGGLWAGCQFIIIQPSEPARIQITSENIKIVPLSDTDFTYGEPVAIITEKKTRIELDDSVNLDEHVADSDTVQALFPARSLWHVLQGEQP